MITSINEFKQQLINEKHKVNEYYDTHVSSKLNIDIVDSAYDNSPIQIFKLNNYKDETYHNVSRALNQLITDIKNDDSLYNFLYHNLGTNDIIHMGNYELSGSDVIDHMRYIKENFDNVSDKYLIDLWNNYLKLVDIIDGIISKEGELSTAFWKEGIEDELNDITDGVTNIKDIESKKDRIINNAKMLFDGLDGYISTGKNIYKFGDPSKINRTLFN